MGAPLVAQVDLIGDEVRRVSRVAEELAGAAEGLAELWEHETVHELSRAVFKAQDAAAEVVVALSRLDLGSR